MKNLLAAALVMALAASSHADLITTNFITNGSFESGNTDFSSDYTYKAVPPDDVTAEGTYSIVTNANDAHGAWLNVYAQNGAGNNFLVANGSTNTALSPWLQTISVDPGEIAVSTTNAPVYYRFQAYIASVYDANPPQLAFEMSLNNSGAWQELTTSTAPPSAGSWYLTYRDGYFLSAPTSISFRLRNAVAAEGGNDFGIDSIYFGFSTNAPAYDSQTTPIDSIGPITGGVVPEPGTWAAAALLAATAGFVRWRRRP